jgi:hypothetical protein
VSYKVKVNDPSRPKGDKAELNDRLIVVPGLGAFENGTTTEISDEQAEAYSDLSSQMVDVESDDRPVFSGAADVELRRGPSVVEAFKDHPTVKVEKVETAKPAAAKGGGER